MKHFLQIYGTLPSQWSRAEPYPTSPGTSIPVRLPRALRSISAFIVSDQVLATHPPALCVFQHNVAHNRLDTRLTADDLTEAAARNRSGVTEERVDGKDVATVSDGEGAALPGCVLGGATVHLGKICRDKYGFSK